MNATAPPRAIRISVWEEIGAGEGIQTSDPNLAKVVPAIFRSFRMPKARPARENGR